MKRTLSLVHRVSQQAHRLHDLGVHHASAGLLQRLVRFRNLPNRVILRTHLQLACLHAKGKNYRSARRHLSVVLMHSPNKARLHYLMGKLAQADGCCDPVRALRHFRTAIRLEPNNARYLSSFGVLAMRNSMEEIGLKALRKAHRLAPARADVLQRSIKALQRARLFDEARAVLVQARFRCGRLGWFRKLQSDFEFFVLRSKQQRQRGQARTEPIEESPAVLAFVRLEGSESASTEDELIRVDGPCILRGPLAELKMQPDQRRAQ